MNDHSQEVQLTARGIAVVCCDCDTFSSYHPNHDDAAATEARAASGATAAPMLAQPRAII